LAEEQKITVSQEYISTLEKKVEDLRSLIDVSSIIASTLDFNDLINLVMEKVKKVMDAEACSILLYNSETDKLEFEVALCSYELATKALKEKITLEMGQGIAGWVAQNRKPIIIEDAHNDDRFYQDADRLTGFTTHSLVAAPLVGRSGLIGVAEVLNPGHKKSFDSYDAEIFEALCRHVAIAIENAKFHRAAIERERFSKELEIASAVQESFLPESPVFQKGVLAVSAVNISASQVGGDIYDFIDMEGTAAGFLIGDVSGKGVSAALYMAKIVSELRYIARLSQSPAIILNKLNERLLNAPRGMFFTCIYIVADSSSGRLNVSIAGHPPGLLISGRDVKVTEIPSGPPLGIMITEYPVADIQLKRGEQLLLLTDGVFDAKNSEGRRIGFDGITEIVRNNSNSDNLINLIVDYVEKYSRGVERADDLTLLDIKCEK
jgi:sigma-B regulation protein RsbU (phosphoserine phosphatase)